MFRQISYQIWILHSLASMINPLYMKKFQRIPYIPVPILNPCVFSSMCRQEQPHIFCQPVTLHMFATRMPLLLAVHSQTIYIIQIFLQLLYEVYTLLGRKSSVQTSNIHQFHSQLIYGPLFRGYVTIHHHFNGNSPFFIQRVVQKQFLIDYILYFSLFGQLHYHCFVILFMDTDRIDFPVTVHKSIKPVCSFRVLYPLAQPLGRITGQLDMVLFCQLQSQIKWYRTFNMDVVFCFWHGCNHFLLKWLNHGKSSFCHLFSIR